MQSKKATTTVVVAEEEDEEPHDFYNSSSDDDKWELDMDPLVNVISYGWTEDGRCGYPADPNTSVQANPRPMFPLRDNSVMKKPNGEKVRASFVGKCISAGSRHTLVLMISCKPRARPLRDKYGDLEHDQPVIPRREKCLRLAGLNQRGLCEQPGYDYPVEIDWEESEADPPVSIVAGNGNSFFITRTGYVYSFGHGRFGVLGHKDCLSNQLPRRIHGLFKERVQKLAVGAYHAIAMTTDGALYSWGRNNKGQLGLGMESEMELAPTQVSFPSIAQWPHHVVDIACGQEHCIAMLRVKVKDVKVSYLYGWGDESRGQLGSGDPGKRSTPQENRWLTKFMTKQGVEVAKICCGGYHNLVLTKYAGQIISWGAGDYGQLGHGLQFDDDHPRIINQLKDVIEFSAGLRHSVAVVQSQAMEVYGWGFNSYGELGLGDTNIRLQPTLVTAIVNTKVLKVSCGDRHTVLLTSHRPMQIKEDPKLKPYFDILASQGHNKRVMQKLKYGMSKFGLDGDLLDKPNDPLPRQAGSTDNEIENDQYSWGLRYCLDTYTAPFEWRRKALETCYECAFSEKLVLKSVCLACARNCQFAKRLRPYIRKRGAIVEGQPEEAKNSADRCDCYLSRKCICRWSPVREIFDRFAAKDTCISPNQLRKLLKALRAPYPVDSSDVENGLLMLAEGTSEESDNPRIFPTPFEKWFRKYFDDSTLLTAAAGAEDHADDQSSQY